MTRYALIQHDDDTFELVGIRQITANNVKVITPNGTTTTTYSKKVRELLDTGEIYELKK